MKKRRPTPAPALLALKLAAARAVSDGAKAGGGVFGARALAARLGMVKPRPEREQPTPAPLVPMPPCTTTPACGHCFYCRVRLYGPEHWLLVPPR